MAFQDYFTQVPVLETERLILRPFSYDDINDYLSFFSDCEVQKYLGGILIPKDYEDAKRWVDNMNGRCLKTKLVITWCIELKATGKVIGRCDLGGFVRKSMADVSYYLSKDYWHMGLAKEAVKSVVDFSFEKLMLHRIQATVLPDNTYSIKLLKSLGFREEGLLRMYDFGKEFKDTIMLSALASDYPLT
jgi:ribosomal-protein-alanine N-acetyltransferase